MTFLLRIIDALFKRVTFVKFFHLFLSFSYLICLICSKLTCCLCMRVGLITIHRMGVDIQKIQKNIKRNIPRLNIIYGPPLLTSSVVISWSFCRVCISFVLAAIFNWFFDIQYDSVVGLPDESNNFLLRPLFKTPPLRSLRLRSYLPFFQLMLVRCIA